MAWNRSTSMIVPSPKAMPVRHDTPSERNSAQGVTTAVNLEGSIFAWANEGLPVYRGETEVDEVHPFDDSWGTLLDGGYWAFEPTVASP